MRIKTMLLTVAGLLLLALGAIGLFLPVLPTTPFVLASAYCLTCNPKLRARIMKIPFFREHIENYQSRKGLPRNTVIRSLVFLWGMLTLSVILMRSGWMALLLAVIGIAVTTHILWIAKPKDDMVKDDTAKDHTVRDDT